METMIASLVTDSPVGRFFVTIALVVVFQALATLIKLAREDKSPEGRALAKKLRLI